MMNRRTILLGASASVAVATLRPDAIAENHIRAVGKSFSDQLEGAIPKAFDELFRVQVDGKVGPASQYGVEYTCGRFCMHITEFNERLPTSTEAALVAKAFASGVHTWACVEASAIRADILHGDYAPPRINAALVWRIKPETDIRDELANPVEHFQHGAAPVYSGLRLYAYWRAHAISHDDLITHAMPEEKEKILHQLVDAGVFSSRPRFLHSQA